MRFNLVLSLVFLSALIPAMAFAEVDSRIVREEGGVTVTVTPLNIGAKDVETADFAIVMDTHSFQFKFDIMRVSFLLGPGDAAVPPVSWDGRAASQHLDGRLSFPASALGDRSSIRLLFKGVGGGKDMIFAWSP